MDFTSIINTLKAYQPQKIILFGSRATGTSSEDSDYDIVLVKDTNQPFHERVIEARRLLRTTMPVDLFVFTPIELEKNKTRNLLIAEILSTGKVVYGQ